MKVDLASFSNSHFNRGASRWKEALWLVVSLLLFRLCPFNLSRLKCWILRWFGAQVGIGVVIKPEVKITFPWKLSIGNHVWLGEECWLLNLDQITIGDNVCISQRAFLCTGNHDYTRSTFDLITKAIHINGGAWIGAGSWVSPGTVVGSHTVLSASSVVSGHLEAFGIYSGNPATLRKMRCIF